MSTIIRLAIVGKTHQRTYRVVAQDKRSKRDGKFLEILGNVNPHLEASKQVAIKKDRVAFWQKNGAQLSPTVKHLVEKGKLPPRPKKVRESNEKPAQPQTEAGPSDSAAPEATTETETTTQEENHTAPETPVEASVPEPVETAPEPEKPKEESKEAEPATEEKSD